MTGHRKFEELRQQMSPEARERVKERVDEVLGREVVATIPEDMACPKIEIRTNGYDFELDQFNAFGDINSIVMTGEQLLALTATLSVIFVDQEKYRK